MGGSPRGVAAMRRDSAIGCAARGPRAPIASGHAAQLRHVSAIAAPRQGKVLGWTPRGNDEMISSTAESLIRLGLVKP